MAIKDKDGSTYKLKGFNPIMRDQQDWNKSKMQLINMGSTKVEIIKDKKNPIKKFKKDFNVVDIGEELDLFKGPEPSKTKVVKAEEFIQDINSTEEPIIKPESVVKPEVVLNVDHHTANIIKQRGVEYYCAPSIGTKEHKDELYGSSYSTTKYGESYLFDAVVIDQSDLELQFWCVRHLGKDSIVYKKVRQGGERWWRVLKIEEKTGGYLVSASVSDSNPDFS